MGLSAYQLTKPKLEKLSPKDRKFWLAISALGIGSILTFANLYFVQPLMPAYVDSYQITPTTASLSLSVAVVALIAGLLFFGVYSDRYGRTTLMKVTLVLSIVPLFIFPFLSSFWVLLGLRIIQGFFIAGLPAAAIAYIGEEFEQKSIGLGITIYIACNAVGGMAGRILIGILSDMVGWQTAIWSLCATSVTLFLLFIWWLPKSQYFEPSHLPFKQDVKGMLVHLKNPVLMNAFMMGIILQISFTGVWTYLPFYLGDEPFNLSMKEISLMYLAYSFGVIGSPVAGKLAQSYKHSTIIVTGILILILGVLCTVIHSVGAVIIGLCLVCLGFFIAHSMTAAFVNMQATHHKGGASSLYLVSYYIGVATGGTATGFIWSSFGWIGIATLTVLFIPITIKLLIDYKSK
ncbi:MFS transporter [Bacillus sp. Marseille-P3661]|uniref:MFS transporter n=1 Tax=Bacillus sp. Marseille-P3661 TaxID=1936234 RepID=UPI000C839990|nr:MFS transporter [Bacillus sp. Marseille-P3661]